MEGKSTDSLTETLQQLLDEFHQHTMSTMEAQLSDSVAQMELNHVAAKVEMGVEEKEKLPAAQNKTSVTDDAWDTADKAMKKIVNDTMEFVRKHWREIDWNKTHDDDSLFHELCFYMNSAGNDNFLKELCDLLTASDTPVISQDVLQRERQLYNI